MEKNEAEKLWERIYGDKKVAYDFAAQEIHKEDYRNNDSFYSWREDFIRPLTSGGRNVPSNLRIESQQSYDIRDGKASFRIGNALFEVRKGRKYGTYALFDVTDRNHPFNREPDRDNQNEFYNRNRFNLIYGKKQNSFLLKNPSQIGESYFKENTKDIPLPSPSIIEMPLDDEEETLAPSEEETIASSEIPASAEGTLADSATSLEREKEDSAPLETEEDKQEMIPEVPSAEEEKETSIETKPEEDLRAEETKPKEEKQVQEENTPIQEAAKNDEQDEIDPSFSQDNEEREERQDLQNQFNLLQDKILSLENENNELSEKNEELSSSSKEQISALSRQISERNQEIETERNRKESLISSLEERKKKQEEENLVLSSSSAKEKEKLEQEKEERKRIQDSLKEENERLRKELCSKEEEKNAFVLSLAEAKKEASKKEEEKQELRTKIATLDEEKSSLLKEKEEKEASLCSLSASLKEKEENEKSSIDSLNQENEQLKKEILLLNENLSKRKEEEERKEKSLSELEKNYSQLDAQSALVDDQKAQLESEIRDLSDSLQDLKNKLADVTNENENNKAVRKDYQSQIDSLKKEKEELSSSLVSSKRERDHRRQASRDYNTKYTNLQAERENERSRWDREKEDYVQTIDTLTSAKDSLSSQLEEKKKKYLFYFAGGDPSYYDAFLFYRGDHSYPYDEEHALKAVNENRLWKRKEDRNVYPLEGGFSLVSKEDDSLTEEKRKAALLSLPVFEYLYGKDKKEACDFAGRIRKKEDFRRDDSPYGWDYQRYDPLLDQDKKSSYFACNLQTRRDVSLTQSFKTNGHSYHLEKEENGYRFASLDDVYDIYDLPKAREITYLNQKKTTPVLYLFVKIVPLAGEEIKKEDLSSFFDLLDKTVHRACPLSFRERKSTIRPKESYAFVTFDGRKEGAYQEVLSYATLLNSYRNAFKKENKLNAIIVLDQVRLPFSYRHLSFENRLGETNNIDRRAVYYHLLQRPRIDSTVKRTIHIGPEILPRLNIPKERLSESHFINSNFALIYNFNTNYVLYNYGYEIKK